MSVCECGLDTEPPAGRLWWRSDRHLDPGPPVDALVRWGEDPNRCRTERLDDHASWAEKGTGVAFSEDITMLMSWDQVGRCAYDIAHPMLTAHRGPHGHWEVG